MVDKYKRAFNLPLAELLDRLTITQIKLVMFSGDKSSYLSEIKKIEHDIDQIISENLISVDSALIKNIIALSQINLHIWNNKDQMQTVIDKEGEYLALLKFAHQLNGFRNKIKNKILLKESGASEPSNQKSNFETDGLNLEISID
jgi:hypothetical protein